MRICVTAREQNLESEIDPRFGRCKYFIFIDPDTLEFEAASNPNMNSMGGAGIQSGQLISEKKASAVLTGNVGPNAFQTLKAAGIEVITGVSGIVKQAAEDYKQGRFKADNGPSVSSKFGI